jgi:hypothetical protein
MRLWVQKEMGGNLTAFDCIWPIPSQIYAVQFTPFSPAAGHETLFK